MSDLSMTVTVKEVGDTQEFGDNGFKKRELVGEYISGKNGEYTNVQNFEFVQDKVTLLDGFLGGEEITIHFNIRCREYVSPDGKTSYFTNLSGWKIDK